MPSSSQILSTSSLVLSSLFSASPVSAAASYALSQTLQGETFLNNFEFYTGTDPTNGYVDFLDQSAAEAAGLLNITSSSVRFGVDSTNTYTTSDVGRPSVKLISNKKYGHGLLIADIAHMPGSICGVWPAFWTNGDGTWPAGGEIDIIEGVNDMTTNRMALHTSDNCSIDTNTFAGSSLEATDCAVSTATAGCYYQGTDATTYGTGFNNANGGVYAMEITDEAIQVWFFTRSAIPESITASEPDLEEFGTPIAVFKGSCDIDSHFTEQTLVFNTVFCGDWAGREYPSTCPMYNSDDAWASCVSYVGNPTEGPSVFAEAYWEINSVKFYEESNSTAPGNSTSSVSPFPTTSASNYSITAAPTGGAGATTSKETITTVITTSYVDICPTGPVTSVVTETVTYCPADQTAGAPPPGMTTKVTVCTACAATPVTTTLTVPATAYPTTTAEAGAGQGSGQSTIYETDVITITSCGPEVTNCPANGGVPATSAPAEAVPVASSSAAAPVVSSSTDISPVAGSPAPSAAVPVAGESSIPSAAVPVAGESTPAIGEGSVPSGGAPAASSPVSPVAGESSVPSSPASPVEGSAPSGSAAAPVVSTSAGAAALVPVPISYPAASSSPATDVSPVLSSVPVEAAPSSPAAPVAESSPADAAATPTAGSVSTIKPWYPIGSASAASNSSASGVAGGVSGVSGIATPSSLVTAASPSKGAGSTVTEPVAAQFTGAAASNAVSGLVGLVGLAGVGAMFAMLL